MVECPHCHKKFELFLECKRCNHKWRPRFDELPEICPDCKSPYWNKERVRGKKK